MHKSLLEYIDVVAEETSPTNIILAVAELMRKEADTSRETAKTSIFVFLDKLKNAGLSIDYPGLKAYYDADPRLSNVIQQFNDREIEFVGQGDEDEAPESGAPTGEIPPEQKVNQMAKAALAKRESIGEAPTLDEGWGDIAEDDPELLNAANAAIQLFKRSGQGRTYEAEMNSNGAMAGIQQWGDWENPDDAYDEEDYDHQKPTMKTMEKAKAIIAQISKQYPKIKFELGIEEKNSIDVYAGHKNENEDVSLDEEQNSDDLNWVETGGSFGKKRRFPTYIVKKEGNKYKAYDEQDNMNMKAATNSLEQLAKMLKPYIENRTGSWNFEDVSLDEDIGGGFTDLSSWKEEANRRGLIVRTATSPDGSMDEYYTAKDKHGNYRGSFNGKEGNLKEDVSLDEINDSLHGENNGMEEMKRLSGIALKEQSYSGVPDRIVGKAKAIAHAAMKRKGFNGGDTTATQTMKFINDALESLGYSMTVDGKYVREEVALDESSEEWNSDEVIRALNASGEEMALDDPELGEFLDRIADRVNQSHPTSVSYSDLMSILNEPWSREPKYGHLQNMAKQELDFALKAAGILESIDEHDDLQNEMTESASVEFSKMTDAKLKAWLNKNDTDDSVSPVFGQQIKAAKRELKKRGLNLTETINKILRLSGINK